MAGPLDSILKSIFSAPSGQGADDFADEVLNQLDQLPQKQLERAANTLEDVAARTKLTHADDAAKTARTVLKAKYGGPIISWAVAVVGLAGVLYISQKISIQLDAHKESWFSRGFKTFSDRFFA
jgi:hypothetical protein